jgi:hypothetical protein
MNEMARLHLFVSDDGENDETVAEDSDDADADVRSQDDVVQ